METTVKEENELQKSIDIDDLPNAPINEKWVSESPKSSNNAVESPAKSCDLNNVTLPNTDNLLDISVRKGTLLGKEQAKKRLYAFSMVKQAMSPVLKKHVKSSENGETIKKSKKNLLPSEKAKAVREEIEEIKKVEHAYFEAIEQGLFDRHHRSRSRSKERHRHHNKERRRSDSTGNSRSKRDHRKYPESWSEIKAKSYSQETLLEMRAQDSKKSVQECTDFRQQFLIQSPSMLLQSQVAKDIDGKDKIVPFSYRRITSTKPKISFSTTDKVKSDCYSRNCLLTYISKPFKDNVLQIINCTSYPQNHSPIKTKRRWYPKAIFSIFKKETECTVLENSLGLSILQNYSDGDEKESEKEKTKVKKPVSSSKMKKEKESKKPKKEKRVDKEKRKKRKSEERKEKRRKHEIKKEKRRQKLEHEKKLKVKSEVIEEAPPEPKKKEPVEKIQLIEKLEPPIEIKKEKEEDTPNTDEYYSNWESDEELLNASTSKSSDLYNDSRELNLCWESETEIPLVKSPLVHETRRSKSPIKRNKFDDYSPFRKRVIDDRRGPRRSLENCSPPFLEMPFNIRNSRTNYVNNRWDGELEEKNRYNLFTDDWEKDDFLTIKTEEMRLEEERRTLIEERRQLEIEKRRLEELERQRFYIHQAEEEEERLRCQKTYKPDVSRKRNKHHRSKESSETIESPRANRAERPKFDIQLSKDVPKVVRVKKSRWSDDPNVSLTNDLDMQIIEDQSKDVQKPELLENEYEKFMQALGSKMKETPVKITKSKDIKRKHRKLKRAVSSSSSSSSSSSGSDSSSSSSSSLSSSKTKRKTCKRRKHITIKEEKKESPKIARKEIETTQIIKIEEVEKGLLENEPLKVINVPEDKAVPLPVPCPKIDPTLLNLKTEPDSLTTIPVDIVPPPLSTVPTDLVSTSLTALPVDFVLTPQATVPVDLATLTDDLVPTPLTTLSVDSTPRATIPIDIVPPPLPADLVLRPRSIIPVDIVPPPVTSLPDDLASTPLTTLSVAATPRTTVPIDIVPTSIATLPADVLLRPRPTIPVDIVPAPLTTLTDDLVLTPVTTLSAVATPRATIAIDTVPPLLTTITADLVSTRVDTVPTPLQTLSDDLISIPLKSLPDDLVSTPRATIPLDIVPPPLTTITPRATKSPDKVSTPALEPENTTLEQKSTPRKNNVIPIKFLTPEIRKMASVASTDVEVGKIPKKINFSVQYSSAEIAKINSPNKTETVPAHPLSNVRRHFAWSAINVSTDAEILNDFNEDVDFTYNLKRKDEKDRSLEEVSTTKKEASVDNMVLNSCDKKQEVGVDDIVLNSYDKKKEASVDDVVLHRCDKNLKSTKTEKKLAERQKSEKLSKRSSHQHDRRSSRERNRRNSHQHDRRSSHHRDRRSSSSPKKKRSKRREEDIARTVSKRNSSSVLKPSKTDKIQEVSHKINVVDGAAGSSKQSPLSSPLDGFKKSVADSTISDDQLLQTNLTEYMESPNNKSLESPKTLSLNCRSNKIAPEEKEPKPIATTYSQYNYNHEYYDYNQYYECYNEQSSKPRKRESSNVKIVQVGNILQVVPTEDFGATKSRHTAPVQQNKITNSTQKILQVGNMLQIVPTTTFPDTFDLETIQSSAPRSPPRPQSVMTPSKNTFNAEVLVKQKAERRAEKDKRREERQEKRIDKVKKRKDREKRKQLKVKMQTEAMIRQALIMEDAVLSEDQLLNEIQKPVQWPPIPQIVCNSSYKPPGKGILTRGLKAAEVKIEKRDKHFDKYKTVKFSDGVRPGEGTSPSAGEELSSPPPAPRKLPKEKRYKKTKFPIKEKVPKKKKVKVKIIRQQVQEEQDSEEDNLLPPPPPPGSPPPHIFPSRIKTVLNNIHPNVLSQTIPTPDTSYPPPNMYRPNVPIMMPHISLHPPGPPAVHSLHLPPPPLPTTSVMHISSYNPSIIVQHGNNRR